VFSLFLLLRRSLMSFCLYYPFCSVPARGLSCFYSFYGQSFSEISVLYSLIVPFILIMSNHPSFILTVLFIILLCHAKYHSSLSPSKSSNHVTAILLNLVCSTSFLYRSCYAFVIFRQTPMSSYAPYFCQGIFSQTLDLFLTPPMFVRLTFALFLAI